MPEVITSRSNARVKQLRAAFDGQARLASGLIAIEGEHLIGEALRSGRVLKTVFLRERTSLPDFVPHGLEVITLAQDVFQSCVETQTPQGLAALLIPPLPCVDDMLRGTPLILFAVGLQDPGNLGTLIRSAEAFGATGVLTSMGTVNPWNGKSIRASAGSIFRVPLAMATPGALDEVARAGVKLLAAISRGGLGATSVALDEMLCGPCAVMIGNEGAGLGPEWLALAAACISIPCPGPVESLNAAVAGSVLLYEISRRRGLRG